MLEKTGKMWYTSEVNKNVNEAKTDDVTVSGWSVERYAQIVKWPAVVAIVFNIIVTTAKWSDTVGWLVLIALTIFMGVAAARIYNGTLGNAAGLGFAASLIVGVASSLFRFLWFHSITAFFEVITVSLLSILVGLLMSTSAFLVLAKEHRPSTREQRRRLQ